MEQIIYTKVQINKLLDLLNNLDLASGKNLLNAQRISSIMSILENGNIQNNEIKKEE